jgi:polyisoprenoid-binding protein YceI
MKLLTAMAGTVLLLLLAPDGAVAGDAWRAVAGESRLEFIATYEGADAPGVFRRFDVRLEFDPAGAGPGRLEVRVDVTSADMDSSDLNKEIAEPEWFDAAAFPQALFVSDKLLETGDSRFLAQGTLSLKGVERRVEVPFDWRIRDGGAVMTGELVLSRTDFGIGSGEWAEDETIGHEVRVRFSVALEAAP